MTCKFCGGEMKFDYCVRICEVCGAWEGQHDSMVR